MTKDELLELLSRYKGTASLRDLVSRYQFTPNECQQMADWAVKYLVMKKKHLKSFVQ